MPISLVATTMLWHRRGIMEKNLIKEIDWIVLELIANGA